MLDTIVRFTRDMRPYAAGERANFSPEEAAHIIKQGYAIKETEWKPQFAAPPLPATEAEKRKP